MSSFSKKFISASLSVMTVVGMSGAMFVPVAQAQSTAELQAQIASLLAQITALQAQLGTATGGTTGGGTSVACILNVTRDLTLGSTGSDVQCLQQYLNSKGHTVNTSGAGSPGNESTYFGALSQSALAKFQAANGISPAAGYFGPITRSAIAAMGVSTGGGTTGGTSTGGGTTTPAPASGLAASLASSNPGAGALVAGAARVPVLAVNLTAGNSSGITVSEIKFNKQGVVSDNVINSAYLIENGAVVAQFTSLNGGILTFSGLNMSIAAGQTRTLTLAIDPSTAVANGNTVSFSLMSASSITAVDAANNAVTTSGFFPLNGNTQTVTTVSNPSISTLSITSSSVGNSVFAGSQGVLVSQWSLSTGNSAVDLKGITFRVIGSANKTDVKNVKLFVNGTQVGPTLAQVNSDGTAHFDLSASPARINTGSGNLQVFADVTGSPSFTFAFQLLNSYDVFAADSQYNVPVSPTIVGGPGTTITIQQGQLTVTAASDTPTGNIAKGGSGTALAKFSIYAAGEAVRVKFLDFDIAFTGGTGADLDSYLKNVALVDDAGGQLGSTINSLVTSKTCASTFSASTSTASNCFGNSSNNINYIIPANTTRVLTLRGDVQSSADFTSLVVSLPGNSNNLQGLTSSQLNSSGAASGSSLSLVLNNLTVSKNSSVGTQTVAKGSSAVRIGSYSFAASAAEGVNLNNITILTSSSSAILSNLKVMVGSTQFGTTQATVSASNSYAFSGNLSIAAGQNQTVDVYADVLSSATAGTYSVITTVSSCSGSGASTFTSVSCGTVTGQDISVQGGSTVTVALNSGLTPPTGQVVMGSTGNTLAAFVITETSNVEDVKITDLNVLNLTADTKAAFNNVGIYVGSETSPRATANASSTASSTGYYYSFNFGNPIIVPKSGSVSVLVKGDVASFNSNGATDNTTHVFKIATSSDGDNDTVAEAVVALGRTSNVAATTTLSSPTANSQTVLRTKLSVSAAGIGTTSGRSKDANDDIGTITFTADSAGTAVLNTITLTFSGSAINSTSTNGITLLDNSGIALSSGNSSLGSVTITSSTSGTTLTKTWHITNGVQIGQGSSYTFKVRVNSASWTTQAAGSASVGFSTTVQNPSDVSYTTAVSGGTSGVNLPNTATPVTINSVTYVSGT